ncbi:MAG: glutamate racemase [Candidatus Babeliales bacterium]
MILPKQRPIGIFDSGTGGLGIFKAIAQRLAHHDLVYVADNANLPFGEKSVEQLHSITETIVHFFIENYDVQMVVVACNTATVTSIDYLRQQFSIPIVGAVPVVKPACLLSKNKHVAILATPTTVASCYLKNLITQYGDGIDVITIGCPGLANLIDTGDLDSPEITTLLKRFLAPVIQHNVDVIGLGCTQYPFLRDQIISLIPYQVAILDSNEPVAKQVERLINHHPRDIDTLHHATYTLHATKNAAHFGVVAQKLIGTIAGNCSQITLELV